MKKSAKKEEKEIKEMCSCNQEDSHKHFHHKYNTGNGCIYGLGLVGSAVFFISQATTFWQGVLGFLKALIWPALMVYELFKYLIK